MEKRTFIIAELSANHNQNLNNAVETIRAAKRVGADAIKLQTYTQDTMTIDSHKSDFSIQHGTAWDGKFLYDLYKEAYTPWEWHKELFDVAKEEGLICFSSPFDKTAVDFLETLNCPIYKIASFEITDVPLIRYVASKGKPIIMSIGIATLEDVELAIQVCKEEGNYDITILKCTSEYPAKPEDANLLTIADIKTRFGTKVGLSDHTMSAEVPMLSVALGAEVIEKHFILDRSIGGPDAHFSLDEKEFAEMVEAVRRTEKILGKVDYELTEKKKKSRSFARSLYVVEDVKKGDVITEKNIRSIRPGYGLHPRYLNDILGKKFNRDVEKGERMSLEFVT
ncbi:N-acetylneuraminic acid synthase [Capnocytophaga canis]|uniref:pseudaminic acid synthase n=1 Tax=Capnocytophaga canis TaxID=1848903 RepID=UPI001AD04E96|nr:pseudaminic acid synthase [Capnocytophaga canis]GIM61840.1 N-acetylneuraminic acid synthase [Capnocytophaga canis]